MKKFILLFIFVMIPLVLAAEWQYNSKEIQTEISIESKINLIPTSTANRIKYVTANLTLYPRDTVMQNSYNLETEPTAQINEDSIFFQWTSPTINELPYSAKANADIKNTFIGVNKKILFPLQNIPKEYEIYTKPSKNIDSDDPDIQRIASKLAEGQDDAYFVLFKLAEWVETNVEYSLDTLTAEVSQKASWVLEQKYGVCDELTSLFVAMARSLGFPAVFVSGVAYTDYQNLNDFGPHAWAEVYLPDIGWIPFDITYGEFGWVDPSHIVLKESIDSDEASVYYQWLGNNVNIETDKLEIKTKIKNKIGGDEEPISITVEPYKEFVGFGSYNLIIAEIKNLDNFYRPVTLYISRTNELTLDSDEKKHILLKPRETKKVFWLLHVEQNLDTNYVYTFPVVVSSVRNISAKTKFKASVEERAYAKSYIDDIIKSLTEEEQKEYSRNIKLECEAEKTTAYKDDQTLINCNIKNIGNTFLENVNVCLAKDCKNIDLAINQLAAVEFTKIFDTPGINDIKITASNKEISKTFFLQLTTLDKPSIEITNINAPAQVNYDNLFEISFTLKKTSVNKPRNVIVTLHQSFLSQKWTLDDIDDSIDLKLNYKGNLLKNGENEIIIEVEFRDENNNKFSTSKTIGIERINSTLIQNIKAFFNRILALFGNM